MNKEIKVQRGRNSKLTNHELLKIVKETDRLPVKLSKPISLTQMVHFYNRYWNNDLTDEEDTSSSPDY